MRILTKNAGECPHASFIPTFERTVLPAPLRPSAHKECAQLQHNIYANDYQGRGKETNGNIREKKGRCRKPKYYALHAFMRKRRAMHARRSGENVGQRRRTRSR